MTVLSVLNYAHKLIADHVTKGDTAIDATVGNGFDTLFLMEQVGSTGCVYGLDIQEQALNITREKIAAVAAMRPNLASNRLFQHNHAELAHVIPVDDHGQIAAIMFNLGYCPGQDHQITTRPETTQMALQASLALLKKNGIITIIVYTGHKGAMEEAEAVLLWSTGLSPLRYHVIKYQFINQINHPSFLIAVEKR